MIRADFFTEPGGELLGFCLRGHSGQGDFGSDVICAAVSSAAYLTANTVTDVLGVGAETDVCDGYLLLRVPEKDAKICRVTLAGFKLHMLGLEEQYPQNINVSYTEV